MRGIKLPSVIRRARPAVVDASKAPTIEVAAAADALINDPRAAPGSTTRLRDLDAGLCIVVARNAADAVALSAWFDATTTIEADDG